MVVVADGCVTLSRVDMYRRCIFEVLRDRSAVPDDGEELDKSFSEVNSSVFIFLQQLHLNPQLFHLSVPLSLEWFP